MRPSRRAGLAHRAACLEAALLLLDVTGLCPGTGPSSQALTLGVTQPVHPTQQEHTGRARGSGSSLGQPVAMHSSPGLHSCGSLFWKLGRNKRCGVCPCPCPRLGPFFWRALFSSRLIWVSNPGPSPLAAEPYLPEALRFLSPWGITFSPTLVLGH